MKPESRSGIFEENEPKKVSSDSDKKKRSSKLLRISEKRIEGSGFFSDILFDKGFDAETFFITNKKKVVAHAHWVDGDLVVTKIRRPNKTKLREGQVIYESYRQEELPPTPEIKTEGWQLIRHKGYDSSQAIRHDPFWENYEGWFINPQKVNSQDGLEAFLEDYPEIRDLGLEILKPEDVKKEDLCMASFSEVDAYVCGRSEKRPELLPFREPESKEVVILSPTLCYCGCGRFEGWHRYWANQWIVYVPRKK